MRTYLELHEIVMMEQSAKNLRDRLLVRLLFHLGCRISEALALEVGDIDLKQGTATIMHLKARIELHCEKCRARLGKGYKFCPVCGHSVEKAVAQEKESRRLRTLPIDSETLGTLREYIDRGGPTFKNGKRLIFGINRHRAWQIIKECAKRTGLPKLINLETGKVHNVSPHRLRDSFAIHAVKFDDSGDGLRLLQEHLGHQSFNTTAKYRKVAGEEHRAWYQRLWEEEKR